MKKTKKNKGKAIGLISLAVVATICIGGTLILIPKESPAAPTYLDALSQDMIIFTPDGKGNIQGWTGTGEDVMSEIIDNEVPPEAMEKWLYDESTTAENDYAAEEEGVLDDEVTKETKNQKEESSIIDTSTEEDSPLDDEVTKETENQMEEESSTIDTSAEEKSSSEGEETNETTEKVNTENYEYTEKDYIQGEPDANFVDPYAGDSNVYSGTLDFGNQEEHVSDFSDLYESDIDMSGWEVY